MIRVHKCRVKLPPLQMSHTPLAPPPHLTRPPHTDTDHHSPPPRDVFTSRVCSLKVTPSGGPSDIEYLKGKLGYCMPSEQEVLKSHTRVPRPPASVLTRPPTHGHKTSRVPRKSGVRETTPKRKTLSFDLRHDSSQSKGLTEVEYTNMMKRRDSQRQDLLQQKVEAVQRLRRRNSDLRKASLSMEGGSDLTDEEEEKRIRAMRQFIRRDTLRAAFKATENPFKRALRAAKDKGGRTGSGSSDDYDESPCETYSDDDDDDNSKKERRTTRKKRTGEGIGSHNTSIRTISEESFP
ncbi:uncharacterized protein LOC106012620 [Aplysia californica]|uniref:Uncharacterized protein LOC106012620 n=1 Tax=Aplysia californica TaxID=6500 RepID=A0ABM1A636_APLCA|nr:uncharacterized protein LOC106012620 [Aplysia californica]